MDDFDMDIDLDGGSDFLENLGIDGDSSLELEGIEFPGDSSQEFEPQNTNDAVNDILAKDMMRLSPSERMSLAEELHGVRSLAIEENGDELTTERISKSLVELNEFLEHKIPDHEKTAFLKAKGFGETGETYVNDVAFRMKFLRCRLFKVEEAARLLVNYLDFVQELYGDICLRRPIRLDDIQSSKEERNAFRLGYCQLLPFGDRAGRRIIFMNTDSLEYSTRIRAKILLYAWFVASNDIATQQRGAILIVWDGQRQFKPPSRSDQLLLRKLFRAIPLRICGIHFCFPDSPFFRMIKGVFTLVIGTAEHRSRVRFHIGEETELKYQVGTFGIPVSQIPITETGNIKKGSFQKWIGMRVIAEAMEAREAAARREKRKQLQAQAQAQQFAQMQQSPWLIPTTQPKPESMDFMAVDDRKSEQISSTSLFVEYPGLNDVAFRKGVSLMHHPGNDFFHGLIQSKISEHENESQTGKSRITWWVVGEVRKRNGRFLSWDQRGWWNVVDDEAKVRLRVAVSFREWKKHLKAEKNRQTNIVKRKNANKFRSLQFQAGVDTSCSSSGDESECEAFKICNGF